MNLKRASTGLAEIKDKGRVLAIFFSKNLHANGVRFLTPRHYPLQVGILEHKNGKHVDWHQHPDRHHKVNTTQEFLYIEKGSAKVSVANRSWEHRKDVILTKGDFILFVDGAHALDISKGSRIIEVKQGPYLGDKKAKIRKT